MRAELFQAQVRRDLRGQAVVLMGKNTMIRRQVHSPRSMQARKHLRLRNYQHAVVNAPERLEGRLSASRMQLRLAKERNPTITQILPKVCCVPHTCTGT